jgi:hypothetical protein
MKIAKKVILTVATLTFLIVGGTVTPDSAAINRPPIGG